MSAQNPMTKNPTEKYDVCLVFPVNNEKKFKQEGIDLVEKLIREFGKENLEFTDEII